MMEEKKFTGQEQLLKKDVIEEEDFSKSIKETAFEEAIVRMFEEDNIEMTSDASKPLILAMSRGDIFVNRFKCDVMELFMKRVLVRSVSNLRKGRGELVALVRNSQDVYDEGTDLTPLAKLFGKT